MEIAEVYRYRLFSLFAGFFFRNLPFIWIDSIFQANLSYLWQETLSRQDIEAGILTHYRTNKKRINTANLSKQR